MSAFYYITASLPMLSAPDQEPPLSSEEMLESCVRFMDELDYRNLEASTLDPEGPEAGGLSIPFRAWEKSLRNALSRLRAQAQGLSEDTFLRETEDVFGTSVLAAEAMGKATPLEAELYLNAQRWQCIDDLANGHFFDLEFLRGYRMKLQILERRAMFEEEKGFAAYRNLYARVLDASGAEVPVGG